MIPAEDIIGGKASIATINGADGSGGPLIPSVEVLVGETPVRKFLGSKEHRNWLKMDLHAAKLITV